MTRAMKAIEMGGRRREQMKLEVPKKWVTATGQAQIAAREISLWALVSWIA